ncbi:uncharacterized protein [Haliotis asinina]|uniref:uncharacterized protein n=1 Tax=Haliotis asinina TaxID=109174 RepID=UPI00353182B5
MKGILVVPVEDYDPFRRDSEKFFNPEIEKVEVTIEGVPNQLFSHGMRPHQQWDEIKKLPVGDYITKDLDLGSVQIGEYLTTKYALWLDMRSTDDDKLHGSGRRIDNGSEGITIQITKKAQTAGPTDDKREKLVALAVGGKAKHYFGDYTPDKIHKMSAEEIDKLYARYESRLGAEMTKTIGSAMTQIYTGIVSHFLPIPPERRLYLWEDLEKDPFIEHAVSSISCGLYHKYGMLLAPVTAAIITAKHCQFERKNNNNSIDVRGDGTSESRGDGGDPSGGTPHTPNSESRGDGGDNFNSNQTEES